MYQAVGHNAETLAFATSQDNTRSRSANAREISGTAAVLSRVSRDSPSGHRHKAFTPAVLIEFVRVNVKTSSGARKSRKA